MSSNTKDLESCTHAATSPDASRSKLSIAKIAGVATAGLLLFFVAGAGAGAALASMAKESAPSTAISLVVNPGESSPDADEAAEFAKIVSGLNVSGLKSLDKEWEALKLQGVAPPVVNETDARNRRLQDGRRRGGMDDDAETAEVVDDVGRSIWTASPGHNRLTRTIRRDNRFTMLVRDKLALLDTFCPILKKALAVNNQKFAYWMAVNLQIYPGHFSSFCLWKEHVKLMYTVDYRYGVYRHRGDVKPGEQEKTVIKYKSGVEYTETHSTTETIGFSVGADLSGGIGAGMTAGLSASFEMGWSTTDFYEKIMKAEKATELTRQVQYVTGYPCVDANGNDMSSKNGQPHYQFVYVIQFADGHEIQIQTTKTIHMCYSCSPSDDAKRRADPEYQFDKQCPDMRLAPDFFFTARKYDKYLCYKLTGEPSEVACKDGNGKRVNWQTWNSRRRWE